MALDRESIQRKDFPVSRRGYDPDAVDIHLRELADEVEQLQSATGRDGGRTASIASAASRQVQAIVEAAEEAARQIREQAEKQASQLRNEARREADATRETARSEAETMRERAVTEAQGELSSLAKVAAAIRERAEQLEQELSDLALPGSASREPSANPAQAGSEVSEAEIEEAEVTAPPAAPAQATAATSKSAGAPEAAQTDARDDVEAARLIVLNMALDEKTREEADAYLAENFDLSDPDALVEEVYASLGR